MPRDLRLREPEAELDGLLAHEAGDRSPEDCITLLVLVNAVIDQS